jgi:hypothetical protein
MVKRRRDPNKHISCTDEGRGETLQAIRDEIFIAAMAIVNDYKLFGYPKELVSICRQAVESETPFGSERLNFKTCISQLGVTIIYRNAIGKTGANNPNDQVQILLIKQKI